jgi:2-C-methyl-D-erythritol 4-phosphate cytidylyltransferase
LPRDVAAIVVAGGQGIRFGGGTPKQYRLIGGVPVVLRALRPFTSHPDVLQVVLVLPASDAAQPPDFLAQLFEAAANPGFTIAPGGQHRGDSVRAGLAQLGQGCNVVLVHDGARPFVERDVIDAVIGYARQGEGAVAAVPLSDTLKEASRREPSRVLRTRPRARLWRAQTPQGFPRSVLEQAYQRAARLNRRASDDAALVEALGLTVRLVPDSNRNLKITTQEDLNLAELIAGSSS